MFDLPKECNLGKKVPMKEYLSMEFKPATRKKIKEQVKSIILQNQITAQLIPSFQDENHNVQAILFLDIYVFDVNKAVFLVELYQELFKLPCVLRIYDDDSEFYSFALKRLNQNDKSKIVVTDKIITPTFLHRFPDSEQRPYAQALAFQNIKSIQNLHSFYCEMFFRTYFLVHEDKHKSLADWDTLWYSQSKTKAVFDLMKELVDLSLKKKKTKEINQIAKINMEIKRVKGEIEGMR